MVSILPLISSSFSFTQHFGTIPSAPTTTGITVTLLSYSFFLVLRQGPSICLLFRFLLISLCGPAANSDGKFFFFFC